MFAPFRTPLAECEANNHIANVCTFPNTRDITAGNNNTRYECPGYEANNHIANVCTFPNTRDITAGNNNTRYECPGYEANNHIANVVPFRTPETLQLAIIIHATNVLGMRLIIT